MDIAAVLAALAALGTVFGTFIAYMVWRESHSDRGKLKRQEEIQRETEPLRGQVHDLELNFSHISDMIESAVTRGVQSLVDQQNHLATEHAQMETKMDFLWGTQKQLAMDAAKILHQPDPRRSHIDQLLEDFMDDTLTIERERELRRYLMQIRNWEPGQDIGFPVHPGEQTAAAILLRTMGHGMPSRASDIFKKDGSSDA